MYLLNKKIQLKVLNLTYKNKLSHLSSTLPAVNILDNIYKKNRNAKVVLSNGHAGLAQYCILEEYSNSDAQKLLDKHGIHPCRDLENNIICSTGSLGLGITVAVGIALGSEDEIHCIISDGECSEGSVWEALKFISDKPVNNLKIHIQSNGYGAYTKINSHKLYNRVKSFLPESIWYETNTKFLNSEDPLLYHYKPLDEIDYKNMENYINEGNIKTFII